jgi:preprotein translocase subunit SecD
MNQTRQLTPFVAFAILAFSSCASAPQGGSPADGASQAATEPAPAREGECKGSEMKVKLAAHLAQETKRTGYQEREFGGRPIYLAKSAIFDQAGIESTQVARDGSSLAIALQLTKKAAANLKAITSKNKGRHLALTVDGEPVTYAPIQATITGKTVNLSLAGLSVEQVCAPATEAR